MLWGARTRWPALGGRAAVPIVVVNLGAALSSMTWPRAQRRLGLCEKAGGCFVAGGVLYCVACTSG